MIKESLKRQCMLEDLRSLQCFLRIHVFWDNDTLLFGDLVPEGATGTFTQQQIITSQVTQILRMQVVIPNAASSIA
jgi:hypothetical protein